MTFPATLSITAASVALIAALLSFGMSYGPGWRELRWFSVCAALAAAFNLSNVAVTLNAAPSLVLLGSRLSLFFGGLHATAWYKYAATAQRRPMGRLDATIVTGGVVLSIASLVPGLVVGDRLVPRDVPWLGVTYTDAAPTAFGKIAFVYHGACLLYLFVRLMKRRARGEKHLDMQCAAVGALLAGAVHDMLASALVIRSPYMLDIAVLVVVLAVGGSLVRSFVTSAQELEVSSRSLAIAHEELVKRERLAALGELAAVVAHEVRNPLAVVFNAIASLKKLPPDSKDHGALLEIVQEEADRLRDIVSDLLDFARPRPAVFAPTAVDEIARAAIASACGVAGIEDDDVVLDVEPGLVPATCDERLVRQAVLNLVTNALQAEGRSGPVRVRVETAERDAGGERDLVIAVADDGHGIPGDERDRIFAPFFSTRPTGIGLGLAVVRRSAEAHGGAIEVTTTPGGGATFRLRLPATPASRSTPAAADARQAS